MNYSKNSFLKLLILTNINPFLVAQMKRCLVLVFIGLLGFVSAVAAQPEIAPERFTGTWGGTLETNQDSYQLVFYLKLADEDQLVGHLIFADTFGSPNFPVSHVSVRNDSLTIEVPFIDYQFKGIRSEGKAKIEGTVEMRSGSFPLVLTSVHDTVAATLRSPFPETQRPKADPADVESPEAIVEAIFAAVSAPEGQGPDLNRFRSLFLPEARGTITFHSDDKSLYATGRIDEYVNKELEGRVTGLHERAVSTIVERYGDIAHVFATYETRRSADEQDPITRGIDTFQLWYDGNRWWIVSVMAHRESEDNPIPERYLD